MAPCADTCALSAVAQTLVWLGVYGWTVWGLRRWVLGRAAVRVDRPGLDLAHRIFSWAMFLAGGAIGIALGERLADPPLSFGLGTLVAAGVWSAANGLFELATGVCAAHGLILRRRRVFLQHPQVRRLGLARLLASALLGAAAAAQAALLG